MDSIVSATPVLTSESLVSGNNSEQTQLHEKDQICSSQGENTLSMEEISNEDFISAEESLIQVALVPGTVSLSSPKKK